MTEHALSRRTVLGTGAALAGAAAGSAALAACGGGDSGGQATSEPQVTPGTELTTLDDVPVGGATAVTMADGQEAIVSRPSADEVAAFSAVCTHQGCTVTAEQAELRCPCHGSTFDAFTGAVRSGPAQAPLPSLDVRVDGGRVVTA